METIQNLIGVLKSQLTLLEELNTLIENEKFYITHWEIDKVIEVAKQKDTIIYKDRILDEAKEKYIKKYCNQFNMEGGTLSDVIAAVDDKDIKAELITLKDKITELASKIYTENMAIKILYSTNLRLISDFFDKIGLPSSTLYSNTGIKKAKTASFTQSA